MNEQPSYTVPAGQRWGTGSTSVLAFLLRDLAQKPSLPPAKKGAGLGVPPVPAASLR